jgi:hypothetical protein
MCVAAAGKSTTTDGTCNSYVKCGPRISKVVRLQKMTFKKKTLRASTAPRYVKPLTLDQLEEWMIEKSIPYISNDKFSREVIFQYWDARLSGYAHRTRMSLGCGDSSIVTLHLEVG